MINEEILDLLTPSDGWWNSSTEEVLIESIDILSEHLEKDDIIYFMQNIINAIKNEYGE